MKRRSFLKIVGLAPAVKSSGLEGLFFDNRSQEQKEKSKNRPKEKIQSKQIRAGLYIDEKYAGKLLSVLPRGLYEETKRASIEISAKLTGRIHKMITDAFEDHDSHEICIVIGEWVLEARGLITGVNIYASGESPEILDEKKHAIIECTLEVIGPTALISKKMFKNLRRRGNRNG